MACTHSHKSMKWPCIIKGQTNTVRNTKRTVNAVIEGAGDVRGAVLAYMRAKPNAYDWYGDEVVAITPLGQRVHVIIEPAI